MARSYPSNTTQSNSTKRTFVKNTVVYGLATENSYQPSTISSYSANGNTISLTTSAGAYGMAYVLSDKAQAGDIFKIEFERTGALSTALYVLCYGSDGSLLTRTGILSGDSFSVALNAKYTVIVVYSQNTGGGSGTFTLKKLEKTN